MEEFLTSLQAYELESDEPSLAELLERIALVSDVDELEDKAQAHWRQVAISACESDGFLEITIRDTGIGIPTEDLSRIFDHFQQGDGSQVRDYSGAGLGLAISHELVEIMGGELIVESTVGKAEQGVDKHFDGNR